jgi:hypothetical protein
MSATGQHRYVSKLDQHALSPVDKVAGQGALMSSSRTRVDVSPKAHRAKRALLDCLSAGEADLDQLANLIGDLHRELHPAQRKPTEATPLPARDGPMT